MRQVPQPTLRLFFLADDGAEEDSGRSLLSIGLVLNSGTSDMPSGRAGVLLILSQENVGTLKTTGGLCEFGVSHLWQTIADSRHF